MCIKIPQGWRTELEPFREIGSVQAGEDDGHPLLVNERDADLHLVTNQLKAITKSVTDTTYKDVSSSEITLNCCSHNWCKTEPYYKVSNMEMAIAAHKAVRLVKANDQLLASGSAGDALSEETQNLIKENNDKIIEYLEIAADVANIEHGSKRVAKFVVGLGVLTLLAAAGVDVAGAVKEAQSHNIINVSGSSNGGSTACTTDVTYSAISAAFTVTGLVLFTIYNLLMNHHQHRSLETKAAHH